MRDSGKRTYHRWWPGLWIGLVILLGGCAGDGATVGQQASDSSAESTVMTAAASAVPEAASPVDEAVETSTASVDEPVTTTPAGGGTQAQPEAESDGISYNEQAGGG